MGASSSLSASAFDVLPLAVDLGASSSDTSASLVACALLPFTGASSSLSSDLADFLPLAAFGASSSETSASLGAWAVLPLVGASSDALAADLPLAVFGASLSSEASASLAVFLPLAGAASSSLADLPCIPLTAPLTRSSSASASLTVLRPLVEPVASSLSLVLALAALPFTGVSSSASLMRSGVAFLPLAGVSPSASASATLCALFLAGRVSLSFASLSFAASLLCALAAGLAGASVSVDADASAWVLWSGAAQVGLDAISTVARTDREIRDSKARVFRSPVRREVKTTPFYMRMGLRPSCPFWTNARQTLSHGCRNRADGWKSQPKGWPKRLYQRLIFSQGSKDCLTTSRTVLIACKGLVDKSIGAHKSLKSKPRLRLNSPDKHCRNLSLRPYSAVRGISAPAQYYSLPILQLLRQFCCNRQKIRP